MYFSAHIMYTLLILLNPGLSMPVKIARLNIYIKIFIITHEQTEKKTRFPVCQSHILYIILY